jgi:predicted flap endonuclease-1-like 5' DNA nuclease
LLIAWLFCRAQIRERESRAQTLQSSLNEKEASLEELRSQASQSDETIRGLTAQLEKAASVRGGPILEAEPSEPDDLKKIEGIGPKISGLLQAAGIMTFGQLAASDVSRLREILTQADLAALADPSTWPEQASLAAADNWDALGVLQDELKGGRRA